jgi:adenine-specific DNA-methyltransferase
MKSLAMRSRSRTIAWKKASPDTSTIRNSFNYLLWYSGDIEAVCARKLYRIRDPREGSTEDPAKLALHVRLSDGTERAMTRDEKREPALLPNGSRIFRMDKIVDSVSDPDRQFDVRVNGEDLRPGSAFSWRGDRTEMHRLAVADRVR